MNEDLLQTISRRLGVLIALQIKTQLENFSTTEGVELLSRFGMSNGEIAEILNTSTGSVNVIKGRLKKRSNR